MYSVDVLTSTPEKVPRSQKIRSRQAGDAQVQSASMTTANGEVIPFDAANVYQASKDAGL